MGLKGGNETEYILNMRMYPSSPLRLLLFVSAVSVEQKEDVGSRSRPSPPCALWGNLSGGGCIKGAVGHENGEMMVVKTIDTRFVQFVGNM